MKAVEILVSNFIPGGTRRICCDDETPKWRLKENDVYKSTVAALWLPLLLLYNGLFTLASYLSHKTG